jgi:hypothetical protein
MHESSMAFLQPWVGVKCVAARAATAGVEADAVGQVQQGSRVCGAVGLVQTGERQKRGWQPCITVTQTRGDSHTFSCHAL